MDERRNTGDAECYAPNAIRFWLSGRCPGCRWAMLESAVEGGTQSGHGAGRGDRHGLAAIKADLERAADALPAHWESAALILRKQHRQTPAADLVQPTEPEHPVASQALENSLLRMARFLGWAEPLTSAA